MFILVTRRGDGERSGGVGESAKEETKKGETFQKKSQKKVKQLSLCRLGDDQARALEVALFVENESGPAVHGRRLGDRERPSRQESAGEHGFGEAGRERVWVEEDEFFFCCCRC